MSGKPFQSCLIPHRDEIFALRRQRPPVSYARIAEILRQKYGLSVRRGAIGKFVKVRAKGRKVYFFREEPAVNQSPAANQRIGSQPVPAAKPPVSPVNVNPKTKPEPYFNFQFSEHYNLHRLTHEEAEALRKQRREEKLRKENQ